MKRYAWLLLVACWAPFWITQGLAVLRPDWFYFRCAEYFTDILSQTRDIAPCWRGYESSDATRDHLFLYQDRVKNTVSFDEEGFRSVPIRLDHFDVLVGGDCNVFGFGLSDSETLPWRLAERLRVPVFNQAYFGDVLGVESVMDKPSCRNARLVIECYVERNLCEGKFHIFPPGPVGSEVRRHAVYSAWEAKKRVPEPRFGFHYLMRRWSRGLCRDVRELLDAKLDPRRLRKDVFMDCRGYHKTKGDLRHCVDQIVERDRWMKRRGLKYLFVAAPAKEVILQPGIDGFTRGFTGALTKELRERGVDCVDLNPVFEANAGRRILFRPYWQQWAPEGVDCASEEISRYIQENHLLVGTASPSGSRSR